MRWWLCTEILGTESARAARHTEFLLQGVFWFILDCLREVEELENLDRSLDVDLGLPVEHDTYD